MAETFPPPNWPDGPMSEQPDEVREAAEAVADQHYDHPGAEEPTPVDNGEDDDT